MKKIQFGAGRNILPGWENYQESDVDIRKPLPFESESVSYIFTEHVIEHVSCADGYRFFEEAYRILKEGGVLRIAFPDILKIAASRDRDYIAFLKKKGWGDGGLGSPVKNICCNHDHVAAYSPDVLHAMLRSVGFDTIDCAPGSSLHYELEGIEGHAIEIGPVFNSIETSVIEATKPFLT